MDYRNSSVELETICLKFLTREEKADVKENNFRCIRDIKEWASKKYQVHFWNQSLMFNGKVFEDDFKNLFELFRENPNDSGMLSFQVLAAKTPFKIKVVENPDSHDQKWIDLEVQEDDTIAQVKEKLNAVKPNYPIQYISLCDYCDPRIRLEDDKTLDFYSLQPRSRVELRRIISIDATLQDRKGKELKQDSFTFVIEYLDDRTMGDLLKDIRKQMDLPETTECFPELHRYYDGRSIRSVVCDFGENLHYIFKLASSLTPV